MPTGQNGNLARQLSGLAIVVALAIAVVPPLARAAPGDLNSRFSGDGVAHVRGQDRITALVALPDGQVAVLGSRKEARQAVVSRFSDDGRLDQDFAADGQVRLELGPAGFATDVAVDGSRRLLISGSDNGGFVRRLSADGEPDGAFGDGGVAVESRLARIDAIAVDSQARVVAVGHTPSSSLAALRLLPSGQPDPSFGDQGLREVAMAAGVGRGGAIAVEPGDSLIVGGARLARLSVSGEIDPTFGDGGTVTVGDLTDDEVHSIALDSGEIVSGVRICSTFGQNPGCTTNVARVSADGKSTTLSADGLGSEVAVAADGDVFDAGTVGFYGAGLPPTAAVSRLGADDERDRSFGTHGSALVYSGLKHGRAVAIALTDRSVLAAASVRRRAPIVASFELGQGRADADADGVADRPDRCRLGFAKQPSGCRQVARHLRIEPAGSRHIGVFVGASTPACTAGAEVGLFARKLGPDRLVEQHVIRGFRRYAGKFPIHPNQDYYVVVEPNYSPLALCRREVKPVR